VPRSGMVLGGRWNAWKHLTRAASGGFLRGRGKWRTVQPSQVSASICRLPRRVNTNRWHLWVGLEAIRSHWPLYPRKRPNSLTAKISLSILPPNLRPAEEAVDNPCPFEMPRGGSIDQPTH
jgi:hypothetical protein